MSSQNREEEYTLDAQVLYPGQLKRRTGCLVCCVEQQQVNGELWEVELAFWLTPEVPQNDEPEEFVENFLINSAAGNVLRILTINEVRKLIAKHFGVAPVKITILERTWEPTFKSEGAPSD